MHKVVYRLCVVGTLNEDPRRLLGMTSEVTTLLYLNSMLLHRTIMNEPQIILGKLDILGNDLSMSSTHFASEATGSVKKNGGFFSDNFPPSWDNSLDNHIVEGPFLERSDML
ncbi:hypothetical protein BD770DRAFT_407463 [Pilaira anomala]|nr:hypothetical protein BD770DRAFT_407463 [Pilaira anomala]